jgi:hypothetical protein
MKKIIKNKVYDTDTARRVGKTLYCKKTREYFIGGKKITPLTANAAREWAEKNLDGDIYITEFGVLGEATTRVTLHVSVLSEIRAKLERLCEESDGKKSISRIIEEAVEKYEG